MVKEELVINTVHNKVNKEDIYFLWIMRKLLKDLDPYMFQNKFTLSWGKWFWMFILNKEERSLLKESKLSHVFLNFYSNSRSEKLWRKILEYELNNEYTLIVYCFLFYEEIDTIIKSNILTFQLLFRDDNLKVFQQKLVNIFWLYWSFTTILLLFHYLNRLVFKIEDIFWSWSVKKNLWIYWEWDITIDISILEKIIKEWKEKFKDKLDLLYLLFSNINKNTMDLYHFDLFFYFFEEWIEKFKINEKDIEEQDSNWEFQTYSIKIHYLCSYIFKEFFVDHVYWWSKWIISFFHRQEITYWGVMRIYDWKEIIEKYKKFDLDYLKKVALLIDQKLYKKFSSLINSQSNNDFLSFFRNILFKFKK